MAESRSESESVR